MLTTHELTTQRATRLSALPDTCTVYETKDTASDLYGYINPTDRTLIATTVCRIARSDEPRDIQIGNETITIHPWLVTIPYTVVATNTSEIVVGARTFRVIGAGISSWPTGQVLECREVA